MKNPILSLVRFVHLANIRNPKRTYRTLSCIWFASWMTLVILADDWPIPLLALVMSILSQFMGSTGIENVDTERFIKEVSEETGLDPDLLRWDLADYMQNYEPK